jgi:hypothetical protein
MLKTNHKVIKVGGNLAAGISQLNSPSTIRPVAWALGRPVTVFPAFGRDLSWSRDYI